MAGVVIHNWARTHSCRPQRVVRPRDEAELRTLVREAAAAGTRVKVIGARHSWSDIAMSEGVLVSLDAMQELLEVDRERGRVRVQAGVRLHRLVELLAAQGLALAIVGSVLEQSIAGVMATGTHGSSLVHGNIPSHVLGLRLLTGEGEVVELDEEHPWLPAARVGLGALGIVTEVSLRVVPAFRLRETIEPVPFDRALETFEALARSAEYVKLWWLPFTADVLVFRYERSEEPGRISPLARWFDEAVINAAVFPGILALAGALPRLVPHCNRLVARTYFGAAARVDRSDRILSLAMPPRHRETEYALPLAQGAEALAATRSLIEAQRLPVDFIVEARFVPADDAWMSPASGRDSCQLGAYMAKAPGIEPYFSGFEAAMKPLGGRPHWGKEFSVDADELARMYPRTSDFVDLARQLDPRGCFVNPFLARCFPRLRAG